MWPVYTGHAIEEGLERVDVAHDDDEHLDDLSEEALVAYFLSLLHDCLDLLPNPLFSLWLSIGCWHLVLLKERLHEF